MSENKATLYKKMAQVMGQLNRVRESGRHERQNWKYATSEDIKDAVRGAMAEVGLALLVNLDEFHVTELKDKGILLRGKMAFTLCCAETGATETCYLWGEAADQQFVSDKAFYKLYTTLEKYFLKTTFLISSGDEPDSQADPDSDHDDTSTARPRLVTFKSPPPPPPPPPEPPVPASNGYDAGEALNRFFADTRVNLGLSEDDTRAILRELNEKFTPSRADELFQLVNDQLNTSVTTEAGLLILVNRETGGYFNHIRHLQNAVEKLDLGIDYPPPREDFTGWQLFLSALIEYGNAGQPDEQPTE